MLMLTARQVQQIHAGLLCEALFEEDHKAFNSLKILILTAHDCNLSLWLLQLIGLVCILFPFISLPELQSRRGLCGDPPHRNLVAAPL